jgi:hypothetical protein
MDRTHWGTTRAANTTTAPTRPTQSWSMIRPSPMMIPSSPLQLSAVITWALELRGPGYRYPLRPLPVGEGCSIAGEIYRIIRTAPI